LYVTETNQYFIMKMSHLSLEYLIGLQIKMWLMTQFDWMKLV